MASAAPVRFMARPRRRRHSWIAATGSRRPPDAASGHAPGEDRAAQEGAFESAQAVHAAAAEARRLADRVEPGDRLIAVGQHAAIEIRGDAAETLAAHDDLANGDERPGALIEDRLRFADAHAVGAILAQLRDAPQRRAVVQFRPARDFAYIRPHPS